MEETCCEEVLLKGEVLEGLDGVVGIGGCFRRWRETMQDVIGRWKRWKKRGRD